MDDDTLYEMVNANQRFFNELIVSVNKFTDESRRNELAALYATGILELAGYTPDQDNIGKLLIHFIKHGARFCYTDAQLYADAFVKRRH